MRLYLARHGEANAKDVDPWRRLTPQGVAQARKVAAFLKPRGLRIAQVWHSGKARAEETAEILASAVACDGGLATHDGLEPDDDVIPVAKEIGRLDGDLMLVGHMPFLSHLAAQLLVGSAAAGFLTFKEAAVACLERSPEGVWRLQWLISPQVL
jgi:phosphohistidine phosphatase